MPATGANGNPASCTGVTGGLLPASWAVCVPKPTTGGDGDCRVIHQSTEVHVELCTGGWGGAAGHSAGCWAAGYGWLSVCIFHKFGLACE